MGGTSQLVDAGVSAREAEVLAMLGEDLTHAEIGARLFISARTVESHVASLRRKLGLAERADLARALAPRARREGVGPQPACRFDPGRRLPHDPDDQGPYTINKTLLDGLAPGSWVVLTHLTSDFIGPTWDEAVARLAEGTREHFLTAPATGSTSSGPPSPASPEGPPRPRWCRRNQPERPPSGTAGGCPSPAER